MLSCIQCPCMYAKDCLCEPVWGFLWAGKHPWPFKCLVSTRGSVPCGQMFGEQHCLLAAHAVVINDNDASISRYSQGDCAFLLLRLCALWYYSPCICLYQQNTSISGAQPKSSKEVCTQQMFNAFLLKDENASVILHHPVYICLMVIDNYFLCYR